VVVKDRASRIELEECRVDLRIIGTGTRVADHPDVAIRMHGHGVPFRNAGAVFGKRVERDAAVAKGRIEVAESRERRLRTQQAEQ